MKLSTSSDFALQPDFATHHESETGRNSQPQSGSAVLASGRSVGLSEWVEDKPLFLRRDADPCIGYCETHDSSVSVFTVNARPNYDLALMGELNGVSY